MKYPRNRIPPAVLIALLVGIISLLHYSTDVSLAYFHDIYKILYYLPIILAAFRYGVRGGLIVSVTISIIYTPHVTHAWQGQPAVIINRFVEMIVFNVVAYITGKLAEGERKERYRYETTAKELQESYEKLEQQSEHLAEVEEQLRFAERLAALGELTASLAHEVRNPLAAIKGAAEIIRDEYAGGKREFVESLIDDVDRINKVIENYLGIASPTRRTHEFFDPGAATRSMVQILQTKARKEQKKFNAKIPPRELSVQGDEVKFRQILMNLLLNAFAATEAMGTIDLTLATNSPEDERPVIEIAIADDGVGIPPEQMQKIFQPFFTTRAGGTGLGLTIARRIAGEYGWKLTIDSQQGAGTIARLIIPLTGTNDGQQANPSRGR